MNTKLLKQKILDLAIRGKLTQQLKSDGTARDLLTQISDERRKTRDERIGMSLKKSGVILSEAQSAKSKDLKQIIPLDKSEAPFEIPENWEWVRLGDVAYIASGSTPSKDCFVESGVPYLKMYNLRNQQIDFEYKPQYIKREIHEGKLARSKAKPGDVIMNIVGPPLGKVALVPESLPECNFNQAAVLIRSHFCTNLMNQYIRYFLLQMDEINAINTKGTAGQENISLTQTQNIRLPLPPIAEQQRIVAKIEEAFAEIDAIEKNKELLKTHIKQTRKKILDLAIHGKLVPQNKSDEPASVLLERITRDNPHYEKLTDVPFEIPDSWEWVKLGDVGKWQSGTTPSKSNSSYYKDGTIPWLNTGDLNDGIIREIPKKVTEKALAETSLRLNEAGSVCIAMYGATIGKIGILSMPATTNQACCVCNNLKNFVNQMWLFYFLKNHKQEFIEAGFGGAQPNISKEKITATLFPLPPLAEQKRIVNKIDEIFASLDEISLHLD